MKEPLAYGIIPARFASIRFPGKPLADILGKPMIWHVFERARRCTAMQQVVVATDDARIQKAAEGLGIPVMMTRADHQSGTERVLEAAQLLKVPGDAVVVNIQGDEPCLAPEMLTEMLHPFTEDSSVEVTTLARRLSAGEAQSPDRVKVVFGADKKALYFSRTPIPYDRRDTANSQTPFWLHIGLYAFRMQTLQRFAALPPSPLERIEKLEQLRLLENGISIHVVPTTYICHGVDRPEDIEAAVAQLKKEAAQAPS